MNEPTVAGKAEKSNKYFYFYNDKYLLFQPLELQ